MIDETCPLVHLLFHILLIFAQTRIKASTVVVINNANTIYFIDHSDTGETPNELSSKSYIGQDVYSAILYDSF